MVKVSHAKCRQCGQARHRNAKFNLCGRCWSQRKPQVAQGWRDIKARRADKRNGEAVHSQEAELIVAAAIEEVLEVPKGRPASLTNEQELEIVDLYTKTDTPVKEIAATYGVGETVPFTILGKHGVSWRRGNTGPKRVLPPQIEAMKEVHVAATPAPEPAFKDLPREERERKLTEQRLEMDARTAEAIRNGKPEVVYYNWRVEYVGTPFVNVMAESFLEAANEARSLLGDNVEIVLVKRLV